MGPALFVILVLCAVVILGFVTYGVFLGLATMVSQAQRFWMRVLSFDSGAALLATPDGSSVGRLYFDPPEKRCWEIHGCSEKAKERCPAHARPNLPCWLANMQATEDYHLRPACMACRLFNIPAMMTHA